MNRVAAFVDIGVPALYVPVSGALPVACRRLALVERLMVTERAKSLTLEEIGRRSGVSRSTVSRVLNKHPDVRPEVRQRVQSVIAETGYRPNPAARALVSNHSGLIGLIMLTEVDELFGDPYYSGLVDGIEKGCIEHGRTFAIFPTRGPQGGTGALVPQVARGFVDGVIVTAGPRSDQLIAELRDERVEMVVVGQPAEDDGLLRVDVENCAGSRSAVEHLLGQGRRRIGFVGPDSTYRYAVERLVGYRQALASASVETGDELVRFAEPTEAGGYEAVRALLAASADGRHIDALHVATDSMAVGVYRALREADLRIPADVAVVGFDGLPGVSPLDPPLTTVVQPVVEVGRAAVALLASEHSGELSAQLLPTELRLGGSSVVNRR